MTILGGDRPDVEDATGPSVALLVTGLGPAVVPPFAGLGAEALVRRREEQE